MKRVRTLRRSATAEYFRQHVREQLCTPAIRIQCGVVDRDFKADGAPAVERGREDGFELLRGKPIGQAKIDGGHDRIVETVGIHVDSESCQLGAGEMLDGLMGRRGDADLANRRQIEGAQRGGQRLAAVLRLIVGIPKSEGNGIARMEER